MTRWIVAFILLLAMAAGSFSENQPPRKPLILGGYRVLSADLHVHMHPLSWAALTPWDTVLEAERQGLDVIALAAHNHLWPAKIGRWFSTTFGGPTVLVTEEIHSPRYHMLATGIESTVSWRLNAAAAIDQVHKQGGIAIAAHPTANYWPAWDMAAMAKLDAAEVVHPLIYQRPELRRELIEFYRRKPLTAVGSSDYHGLLYPGFCRTYIFAVDNTPEAVLDALRKGRTVVYDSSGAAFGDPHLVSVAGGELPTATPPPPVTALSMFSRLAGAIGLIVLIVLDRETKQSGLPRQ